MCPQALGLDRIEPLASPAVKDRWTKTSAAVSDNGLNPQWSQARYLDTTPQSSQARYLVTTSQWSQARY
eukprot:scaffold35107_cov70-Phaeocystis_antarctica.AAC.6